MRKKILSLVFMLLFVGGLCLPASAHEVPDFDRRGSISIAMTYRGRPIEGGSLTIYRVADVVEDNGDYVFAYTAEFADASIPVTELDSARLPQELERIVREKRLRGITQELNRQGKTKFSDLEIGLYLVVQWEAAPGFTKINPFLVTVPYNDDGHYVYDVDTSPKNIPEPEPTEPEPTEPPKPDDDKLPQTGQTNWPIPVMAVGGMLLVAAGLCLRASEKKKYEA